MNNFKIIVFIFITILTFSCSKKEENSTVQQEILINISRLNEEILHFEKLITKKNVTSKELQLQFKKSRLAYKKIEWAVEYFVPETARLMNGPALDEIEIEENKSFEPHGFQVMEELLSSNDVPENKKDIQREIAVFLSNNKQIQQNLAAITISNNYVLDALQQNVFRITTLGITGFDSPIFQLSIPEAAQSLSIIPSVLQRIDKTNPSTDKIEKLVDEANSYCKKNNDFNSFNRAEFILNYLNPISRALKQFQYESKIEDSQSIGVINPKAETLFDKNAFNVDGFVISKEYRFSTEKAHLGEKLFYDKRLSQNNSRSCSTCHIPEKAFTDGLQTNISLTGSNLKRNTPTLTYASLQNAQFWDLRQLDLEKQSIDVIENKDEMHGSLHKIQSEILNDSNYVKLFKNAYPNSKTIETWQIQNAIASYIRSLNAFDSRFDEFMRGNKESLNQQEITGMNLFMGKAKCATCHFSPLFNGTVPPNYVKTEHEVVGTPQDAAGKKISPDLGRYLYNEMPQLKGAFKTPTLRNVAVTAPYMHNGVYKTLKEVVDFYNKGGGIGLGYEVDNQTLPFDKLNLTEEEVIDVVAFMKALTDKKYEK